MTTKEYLMRLPKLQRMIDGKRREAKLWHDIAEKMSCSADSDRVQTSRVQDKMADALAKAVDSERDAEAATWLLVNEQQEILRQLDGLDDTDCGLLLREHYVHGMSLGQIADEWGVSYRHVKRLKVTAEKIFSEKYGI